MRTDPTSDARHARRERHPRRWWTARAALVMVALAPPVVVAHLASDARADDAPAGPPSAQGSPATKPREARGLAVIAIAGGESAAWTLAQAVYATDALRPSGLDEAHARVLAGEPPDATGGVRDAGSSPAAAELRDLADTRAAIRGDDAPSRALLASIANTFRVRGIVVVEMSRDARPVARVFLADTGAFDAARYDADPDVAPADAGPGSRDPSAPTRWARTVASLARTSGAASASHPEGRAVARLSAEAPLAPVSPPKGDAPAAGKSGAFYTSPWFWGAVGAAAFGGAAVYFATRDNGDGTIHLQLQVPK